MLLAIDTATRWISLALHDGRRVRCELSWETHNRHTVELMPAIQDVCTRAGVGLRQVDKIAVCQGPGSFSGLRIGIAAAKGLAMSLGVKLVAISSLDITVAAVNPFPHTVSASLPVIAVASAGRGRVCAGRYLWEEELHGWNLQGEIIITAWPPLLETITQRTIIVGEIDDDAHALIVSSGRPVSLPPAALNIRRAAILADLALRHDGQEPGDIRPLYVNQPGLPYA